MSEPSERTRVPRRLVAILAADIAGYSALMGTDEAQTVRDLKDHLAAVLPMVSAHGGRVIDTAGDGILAEFGSVVNAVECAVAMQKAMTTRNAQIEDGRQMQFRIGINIGDVIHDETRLYGDGVNVAARLEAAAEPGGICISGAAYEQVRNKLALEVGDLGLHSLKNIAEPVRIYRIMTGPSVTPAQARPLLAIPDKPSIAVLPFANLSSNPEHGVSGRWYRRRHHYRFVAVLRAVRHRSQLELPVQWKITGHTAGRPRAWGALRSRRQHPSALWQLLRRTREVGGHLQPKSGLRSRVFSLL
jgi:class 3 adenylate cyclase